MCELDDVFHILSLFLCTTCPPVYSYAATGLPHDGITVIYIYSLIIFSSKVIAHAPDVER